MLRRIIEWSIDNQLLVTLGAVAVVAFGSWAMLTTPVDAVPDLSDVQVIVHTEWRGQAPQVIEDQVTYPLSTEMLKVPNTKWVRGISDFGQSLAQFHRHRQWTLACDFVHGTVDDANQRRRLECAQRIYAYPR